MTTNAVESYLIPEGTSNEIRYDFSCLDRRGRQVGAVITTWEDSANNFIWEGQATRDNFRYGACRYIACQSEEERDSQIKKYLVNAEKRAKKAAP
jgi:hypothetical protein